LFAGGLVQLRHSRHRYLASGIVDWHAVPVAVPEPVADALRVAVTLGFAVSEPKPGADCIAKSHAKPVSEPVVEPDADTLAKPDPNAVPVAEPEPDSVGFADAVVEPNAEPDSDPVDEPHPDSHANADRDPEPTDDADAVSEPKSVAVSGTDSYAEWFAEPDCESSAVRHCESILKPLAARHGEPNCYQDPKHDGKRDAEPDADTLPT
jgi:hypothetical protein